MEIPTYNFDFSRPVIGHGNFTETYEPNLKCSFDKTIIDQKLRLWEDRVKKGYLTDIGIDKEGNVIDKVKYSRYANSMLLLKDKGIFAYSMFKFNNKPMVLRYYQDALLSDDHDRILFCAANQIGKSLALDIDAATEFIQDHKKEWVGVLVSKSLDQSQFQMDRIKQLLKSANIDYRIESTRDTKTGRKDNTTKISYTFYDDDQKPLYTNLLICSPPSGSALGYPCDYMWLDEFDFWENIDQNWFMYQIAIPRTFDTNGKIKIFTNPDGVTKMLHKLWTEKDKKGNPVWHRYQFNYWDKPGASQEDFDKKSQGMTRSQIESTLLAIFSQGEKNYFSSNEIKNSYDETLTEAKMVGKQPFFALDIGAKHDQSVLVGGFVEPDEDNPNLKHIYVPIIQTYPVGYPLARVVGSKVEGGDGWAYVKSVKEYLDEWGKEGVNPYFGVDVTGNSGITPLFNSANIYPTDITLSGPVKSGMYQRFKYFMEKGLLHRIHHKDFEYQASHLQVKKSQRGYLMIHHENEDDLDDVMDSVAMLIHLADSPNIIPATITKI